MPPNCTTENGSHGAFALMYIFQFLKFIHTHTRAHTVTHVREPSAPYLPAALILIVRPGAGLVIQQWADQGRGLLGVRAQVGRQGHVGRGHSPLRVHRQLGKVRAASQGACLGMRSFKEKKKKVIFSGT